MKYRHPLFAMLLLLVSFHLSADAMAGIGTEAEISFTRPSDPFNLGINGQFLCSSYAFPSTALALYGEAGGIITYWPQTNTLQTKAAVTGEISYQSGSILLVPALKSRLNAFFPLYAVSGSLVQTENLVSFLFSWGNTKRELRLHPRFHFNLGTENSFGPGGEVGYIFSLSPATFFDISLSSKYLFLQNNEYHFTLAPRLALTSYPLYSFSTTTEIWYNRSISSALSLLGEYPSPLPADTYHEIGVREEMLISISPALDLNVFIPVSLFFKSHPALEGSALSETDEHLILFSPEIGISADLSKHLILTCSLSGELPFSNSDYQRTPSLNVSAVLFVDF